MKQLEVWSSREIESVGVANLLSEDADFVIQVYQVIVAGRVMLYIDQTRDLCSVPARQLPR